MSPSAENVVVIGIGNLLWADEGFGVRCLEALRARYTFAPEVSLIDGGTQGLYLLPYVQGATRLMIFDAVDYGLPGGTLHCVRDAEVPRFLGAKKLSLHQTGFQEVLALAELTGSYPRQVLLIGCQPVVLDDYGGSLSTPLRAAVEQALGYAASELTHWGVSLQPSAATTSEPAPLALERYENERPSASLACRTGDARFFGSEASEEREMCVGVPMQVQSVEPGFAWALGRGERRRVSLALVGDCLPGQWLLVFLDSARERLAAVRASEINEALDLLEAALAGGTPQPEYSPSFALPSQLDAAALAALISAAAPPKEPT